MSSLGFGIQEDNHFPPLAHEIMPGTAQLRKGYLYGSDKPGPGIDINEELAAKYPMRQPADGGPYRLDCGVDGAVIWP